MAARLALLLALSLVSRLARADEPGLGFEWRAPEGCPPRQDVMGRAEKLLGRPLASGTADLEIDAEAAQLAGEGWQLDLHQRSRSGVQTRSVRGASCDELADAAALFLALSIDPSLAALPSARASASFPTEPIASAEPTTAAAEPAVAPVPHASAGDRASTTAAELDAHSPPPRVHVGLAASMESGRMPSKLVGGLLQVGVSHRSWLWRGEVSAAPPQHAQVSGSTAGGDLRLVGLAAGAGYLFDFEPMSLGPVAGVELGWLHGSGTGVDNPSSADALLLGVHAGSRYALTLARRWGLVAFGNVWLLANRPRFVLDGIGPVYQPERWGWRLGVGLEWRSR